MRIIYPNADEAVTPEYVLAVIRDNHRQQSECDFLAGANVELGFACTVEDWRDTCELVEWDDLGRALNEAWNISRPLSEWKQVLEPAEHRTLRDVCDFIATHAVRKRIRLARLLGTTCLTAGAFLTIRSILHSQGVEVRDVRPSTPLDACARLHLDVFLGPISALAPGQIPAVSIYEPGYCRCLGAFLLGILATFILAFINIPSSLLSAAGTLCFYVAAWVYALRPPKRVVFGDLRTFGDLARVLAAE